jgi:putative nucleotidyltransferase with HDIG domain
VARLCNLISRQLGLDEETRREIHFAAMLHDIGFLKMRDVLVHTDAEGFKDMVKEHPVQGAQLIEPIMVWKDIAPLILHHHEHFDGTGYPQGLKQEEIPLGSRIICVAEVFDAMTNEKSYTVARNKAEAIAELETYSGTRYDSKVVTALVEVLEEEK